MFILKSEDVKYSNNTLFYRGFTFDKVANVSDSQQALKVCRKFLDLDNPVASIIVKDKDCITVWAEIENFNTRN